MNQFKRFLALMLVLCVGFSLCACGGDNNTEGSSSSQTTAPSTTQGTESTAPTESTSDGKLDYKVTVLYPDGTPAVGCYVQICLDTMCYTPEVTDENGVATFHLKEQEGYKTKLAVAIEGYVEADYIYFESGSTEITINLVAVE